MKLHRLRSWVQWISFLLLTYGGHIGLHLGHFLPCFSCPYAGRCGGHCYLMAMQGGQWGLQMSFAKLFSVWGLRVVGMFTGFLLLALLFSKTWCGWICPFGTLQDWISSIRKRLGVRESSFSWQLRDRLRPLKYILLALLIAIPVLIANFGLHADLRLPFCQICPAKPLMPVFEGNFQHFAIDQSNPITAVMSLLSVMLAAMFLVGMFFKERFFCLFCPMLAILSFCDRFGFVRLEKNVDSCISCGNCERACPMDIRQVYLEKCNKDVLTQDCIECFQCAESCPQSNTLSVRFLKWRLFSSAREYVANSLETGA